MPERFDDEFIRGAAFVEPSHAQRRRRWRRRGKRAVRVMTIALVAAGVVAAYAFWWTRDVDSTPAAAPSPTKSGAGPPVPGDPFAGSPAASYADGAAGIVVPKATAMGGFSAKQVATAYARTKRMLVAAGLDRKALLGGDPDAFAAALDPPNRTDFRKDLKPGKKSTRSWLVSFAPRSVQLSGSKIKVHGTMSAKPARRNGIRGIEVKVDYLLVYAVQKPRQPATVQRLVTRLTGIWFQGRGDGGTYWLIQQGRSATPAHCRPDDGFIRPAFPDYGGDPDPEGTGTPIDPYDRSRPDDAGPECQKASRT